MLLWLGMCLLLCLTIIMVGYELVDTPNALKKGNYNSSLCELYTNDNVPAKRLVIFIVDGMTNNSADKDWMSKIIDSESYGYGEAIASKPITRAGLVAIFAGYYEHIIKDLPFIDFKSINETIFKYVKRTYYFGPKMFEQYFKIDKSWNSRTYTMSLNVDDGSDNGDENTLFNIRKAFHKSNQSLIQNTRIFYVHFTSVNHFAITNRRAHFLKHKAIDKVASMIGEIVALFNKQLPDSRTVYMILSDHGMTDWGTNADSLADEIITPVILWGNQIAPGYHGTIQQIDLCPLIASLLGTVVPAYSLGAFMPQYMELTQRSLAHSAMCVAIQQAELCQNTWMHINNGLLVKHVLGRTISDCSYEKYMRKLKTLMDEENYTYVIETSANLTRASKSCIRNIENFYKSSLLFVLIMSYFAWIFGTVCVLNISTEDKRFTSCAGKFIKLITLSGYLSMCILSIASIILENLPTYYIIFVIIPSMAWMLTSLMSGSCITKLMKMKSAMILLYILAVLLMAEFTYWAKYYPYIFSCYLIPQATFLIIANKNLVPFHVTIMFFFTCVALTIAPSMPIIGLSESPILLNVSAAIWVVLCCFFAYALDTKGKQCLISLAMTAIICLSTWIVDLTYLGANTYLKILSWCVLPVPIIVMFASKILAERLLQLIISMGGPYLLLSIRHESIVFIIIALNLYSWLRMETSGQYYDSQNFIRGVNLHFYTTLAIFASGNLPYLNSYDIMITRIFTSSPGDILLAVLAIYKITLLLTVIVCFYHALCLYTGQDIKTTVLVATVISAISSARHALAIIISDDPIHRLPEFLVGNILFLLLIIPFFVAPLFIINIKKIKS